METTRFGKVEIKTGLATSKPESCCSGNLHFRLVHVDSSWKAPSYITLWAWLSLLRLWFLLWQNKFE